MILILLEREWRECAPTDQRGEATAFGARPEPRANPVRWKKSERGLPDLGAPTSGTRSFWNPKSELLKTHKHNKV